MAVNGKVAWRRWLVVCSGLAALAAGPAHARDEALRRGVATAGPAFDTGPSARDVAGFREGPDRLQWVLRDAMARTRTSVPEWVRYRAGDEIVETSMAAGRGDLCLVLQEGRYDGTDLLTARYTLIERSFVRAYAGAGLNRTVYFHDDPAVPGPSRLDHRHRDRALGAAAEFGAEFRLSERVQFSADVRWAELDERALVLRTERGPVGAAPLVIGLAIGYRFR